MSEEVAPYLANYWQDKRNGVARQLVELAKGMDRSACRRLDAAARASDERLANVAAHLAGLLRNRSLRTRRAAARLLAVAFAASRRMRIPFEIFTAALGPAVPALARAVADPDEAVRLSVLASLEIAAPHYEAPSIVMAVAEHALRDARPRVALQAVQAVMAGGLDAASAAAPTLTDLLRHPDERVRQSACEALAFLGPDGRCAVPALVDLALQGSEPALQRLAALALARIDHTGESVAPAVSNHSMREALLTLLRATGRRARSLRRGLQAQWAGKGSATQQIPKTRSPQGARHSIDYRSVNWFGTPYTFTMAQAEAIKVLWEHWEQGTPEIGGVALLVEAEVNTESMRHLFRDHEAWGTMIVTGSTKGSYRLMPFRKK